MTGTTTPAPSGTLWLHVGTHKTGSTSIQEALSRRAEGLNQRGRRLLPEANAWALANLFLRPNVCSAARMLGTAGPESLKDFDEASAKVAVALRSDRDMIISSEAFCLMREALEAFAIRAFFRAHFARIVPVVILRREEDWRRSREDQLRKTGLWERQRALADRDSADGSWYYDRGALLRFWSMIGSPQVIDYDEAMAADGSILPAFGRAIGLPDLFEGLDLRLNSR